MKNFVIPAAAALWIAATTAQAAPGPIGIAAPEEPSSAANIIVPILVIALIARAASSGKSESGALAMDISSPDL